MWWDNFIWIIRFMRPRFFTCEDLKYFLESKIGNYKLYNYKFYIDTQDLVDI